MPVNTLLPKRTAVEADTEVTVLHLEEADDVFEALASEMARAVLKALSRSPGPPSEIADAVDSSIQNVSYHLDRLEAAGLVEATETWYSPKGQEMDVYAPTASPLVVCTDCDKEEPGDAEIAVEQDLLETVEP